MASMPSERLGEVGLWAGLPDTQDFASWAQPAGPETDQDGALPGVGLIAMVESEIIPRLMLAHRSAPGAPPRPIDPDHLLGPETTETFARMVVSREPDSLIAFVGGLLQSGVSLNTIYTELLVPAARRLGDYWDEDSASFTDVTVGLGRLQQVVRALGVSAPSQTGHARYSRSAFFAPGPGEQHMFGLFIVEDYFRRAGWRTWVETTSTQQDLAETVANQWFDVFGVSVSVDTHLDELTQSIQAARKASRNPDLFVMVGGRLFLDRPELVTAVTADATAASGGEALLLANHALLIADNEVSALASGG